MKQYNINSQKTEQYACMLETLEQLLKTEQRDTAKKPIYIKWNIKMYPKNPKQSVKKGIRKQKLKMSQTEKQ